MMPKRPLTLEQRDQIAEEAVREHLTYRQIAERYGLSVATAYQIMSGHGYRNKRVTVWERADEC
jgi:transposase